MVAKGHDFPDVTLGVVLDADSTLRFPDFRAEERTFALIAQLAGRAGRGPRGGRVLVQTDGAGRARDRGRRPPRRRRASWPASSSAGEALRYPPFADLIRVVCLGRGRRGRARAAAGAVADGDRRRAGHRACSARRRCSACAAASASRSWSRRPSARPAIARRRRARSRRAARDRALRDVAFSVDVDPQ